MGIVYQGLAADLANQPYRKHGIEVDAAEYIGLLKKQEEEKPDVEFGVKGKALLEKTG